MRLPSLIKTNQRRRWHPTPVLLLGKSYGQRSLVGCSPRGREESDTTERLHFHFSLSFIGEGNGNPLQCSCLENPRDGGAWWAAVYGVAQSQTRLKRLSSSSIKTSHATLATALTLCNGPYSICGVYFSLNLNKSTSYLSLCLSLNSFCDGTVGFGWVWVPATWVQVPSRVLAGLSPSTWVCQASVCSSVLSRHNKDLE